MNWLLAPGRIVRLCGISAAFGLALKKAFPNAAPYGELIEEVSVAVGLLYARQNNVTSEQAGAKDHTDA